MRKKTFRDKTKLVFVEVRMVASTALGLFAGRKVWMPEDEEPEMKWIDGSPKRNLDLALSSYDERLKSESAGIEAVRRRAEFALTAIIAAIGLSTAAFERLWAVASSSTILLVMWSLGVLIVVVAVLVFAGVAVSNKVLGIVKVEEFVHLRDPRRVELRQYVLAVHTTSRTRRAMVTVFRDGFLIALVGLTLLAIVHTVSWVVPLDDAPTPVDVNSISSSLTP